MARRRYIYMKQISGIIDDWAYDKIKSNKWQIAQCIYKGIESLENSPKMNERIMNLERANDKLQQKITRLYMALSEVKDEQQSEM
jgi:hypothetical protein